MVARRALIVPGMIAVCGALWLAGCSNNVAEGTVISIPDSSPKPPESVSRLQSPAGRTGVVLNQIAQYRYESGYSAATGTSTFNAYPIAADNVLFTAAFRHAVYLNTLNSAGSGVPGSIGPGDTGAITASTSYEALYAESVVGGSPYPSLYTGTGLENRVKAVVGGGNLLTAYGSGNMSLAELYVFDGDVSTGAGTTSDLRGYPYASSNAAENIWYSRRGRQHLMRPSLRYIGFGQKDDPAESGRGVAPPYPILSGQFIGTWVLASSKPAVSVESVWPNDGNQNVNPFGLDTDMNGPLQYSGPPIHMTLPVSQPFTRENGLEIALTRVTAYKGDTVAPSYPYSQGTYRQMRVFTNVSGLTVVNSVAPAGGYSVQGTQAPIIYQAPMAGATNQGAIITDRITTHYRYRIAFGGGTDLGTAVAPLVAPGDTITIAVAATLSPYPTSASIGEYQYSIEAVNYTARTVDVLIPVFDDTHFPFEASPLSPSTLMIRYGNTANVALSVTSATANGSVTVEVDNTILQLNNGEVVIVPTAPLEPNAWYQLTIKGKTFNYTGTQYTSYFKTNNKGF